MVSVTPIFISFTVTGDNGDMGQGNVSLPRNYETKEHFPLSEVGILTRCSKKLWSHENSNLGFNEIMKRENRGISCSGYRGLGKMDRGQENGGRWKRGGREWKQRTKEGKQEETAEHRSGDRGQGKTGP